MYRSNYPQGASRGPAADQAPATSIPPLDWIKVPRKPLSYSYARREGLATLEDRNAPPSPTVPSTSDPGADVHVSEEVLPGRRSALSERARAQNEERERRKALVGITEREEQVFIESRNKNRQTFERRKQEAAGSKGEEASGEYIEDETKRAQFYDETVLKVFRTLDRLEKKTGAGFALFTADPIRDRKPSLSSQVTSPPPSKKKKTRKSTTSNPPDCILDYHISTNLGNLDTPSSPSSSASKKETSFQDSVSQFQTSFKTASTILRIDKMKKDVERFDERLKVENVEIEKRKKEVEMVEKTKEAKLNEIRRLEENIEAFSK